MSSKKYNSTDKYKKFLLNRVTVSSSVVEYLENCVADNEEATKYSFHKIMVHNWPDDAAQLFDTLSSYLSCSFIPSHYSVMGELTTFYVDNITLIIKIIKFDFMFPYSRNIFSIDILLYDKTSMDLFGELLTLDDIVSNVVSQKFTQRCELDLSNFCEEPEFIKKKVCFYKLSLLSSFKILMLRMGRDTKSLNLSNNYLSVPPLDILNFFIKADLTEVNLSNNNISSISDLFRVSSKIEKLWIEGNPLCANTDPLTYIKQVTVKFPRLTELDGVQLNAHGLTFPFVRNYVSTPDERTKNVVDSFLSLYFGHYDAPERQTYLAPFYDRLAKLTIVTNITDLEDNSLIQYVKYSRNLMKLNQTDLGRNNHLEKISCYKGRNAVSMVHSHLPATIHDPCTFTVDVLVHDSQRMILVVDGIFKQKSTATTSEHIFQFRRTFVFAITDDMYMITNEMYYLNLATTEQISHSFKQPIPNMNVLQLVNPSPEVAESIIKALQHVTQLKASEVEVRLKCHNWNITETLTHLIEDMKKNKVVPELFLDDDFSDISSILDEID